jgi:hypothetical protein
MEITMSGQVAMKQVFDGEKGYQSQMGQKEDMDAEETADKKAVKSLFPQLQYGNEFKIAVKGIEKVADADAYVLEVTKPSGKKSTEYYDVKTGYLVKESEVMNQGGMEITQATEFSDYKQVGNILIPHKVKIVAGTPAGEQEFVIKIESVKVNEPINADDFK